MCIISKLLDHKIEEKKVKVEQLDWDIKQLRGCLENLQRINGELNRSDDNSSIMLQKGSND